MALLETIKMAAAGGGEVPPSAVASFPVILNGKEASRHVTPEGGDSNRGSLIKRAVGWKIPEADEKTIQKVEKLAKKLNRMLKSKRSLDLGQFQDLLNSIPETDLGEVVNGEVLGLLADGCVSLDLWETLESFIRNGLIGRIGLPNLVEKLVKKNRSDLLCLYVNQISEIRVSELLLILQYFLSPPRGSRETMIKVREEWRRDALVAIEKTALKGFTDEVANLAKEASILLMAAHDGFSLSELCLHSFFSSKNIDGIIASSAISRLGNAELMNLVKYLRKWLEKYEKFPGIFPCPDAATLLGLKSCQLVPSIESVATGLALAIDEHYSFLVLNSQFHDEMNSIGRVVESLVSSASLCSSVTNVIENLRQPL